MYLTAIIDWYSRCIVSWRLSDTMKANEVVRCAEDAFREHGISSIMNSDQGSVFGSEDYAGLLKTCHMLLKPHHIVIVHAPRSAFTQSVTWLCRRLCPYHCRVCGETVEVA